MIKKYNLFKESLLDKLHGPTDEEFLKNIKDKDILDRLVLLINNGVLKGVLEIKKLFDDRLFIDEFEEIEDYNNFKHLLCHINIDYKQLINHPSMVEFLDNEIHFNPYDLDNLFIKCILNSKKETLDYLLKTHNKYAKELFSNPKFNIYLINPFLRNDYDIINVLLNNDIFDNNPYYYFNKAIKYSDEKMGNLFIKKYNSNESLLDKLQGPSDEEILNYLNTLNDSDKIRRIIILGEEYYKYLPDDLIVKGNLDCSRNQLTSLPDNLRIDGFLNCSNNELTILPNNLVVDGNLYCFDNKLTSLPDNLVVKGNFNCSYNQLTSLPDSLIVNGYLDCSHNKLISLPDNLKVNDYLYCNNNKLTILPDNLVVKGSLDCSHNQLTSLPDNLIVNGSLNCSNNELTSLPDNLVVNGYLDCSYNELTTLPNNLVVRGSLDCRNNKIKLEIPKTAKIKGKIYN